MKKIIGLTLLVICASVLIIAFSCSLEASNSKDSASTGIAAPTILADSDKLTITSAPIKDEYFLSTVTYANIFRMETNAPNGTGSWKNIGQVVLVKSTDSFDSFSFFDPYVTEDMYYSYVIRYCTTSGYVSSGVAQSEKVASGKGTKKVSASNVEAYYERNDESGIYTLCLTAPAAGITDIPSAFTSLCLLISNGSSIKPFEIAVPDTDASDATLKTVAIPTDTVEMHKLLPEAFLDVNLTAEGLILVTEKDDDTKKYKRYYWTEPVALGAFSTYVVDEDGNDVIGTAGSPQAVDSFYVPSIPAPTNEFDATNLSLYAGALNASAKVQLDVTPLYK